MITPVLITLHCLALLGWPIRADGHDETSVIKIMEKHGVVPDVIPVAPPAALEVSR